MSFRPKLRQLAVVASAQLAALSAGAVLTFPTVLMEQFGKNDTNTQLDMDTRSWIGAIHGFAGIPAILMPIIAQAIGRKFGFMLSSLFVIAGWILAYTAETAAQILISESFHSLGTNSLTIIMYMSLSEMLAPKYRYVSMQILSIINITGMAVCGILGRYFHYKTISLVMLTVICISLIMAATWPDSPYWLACRGRFDECETAFFKLRGNDEVSIKELKELIAAQREYLSRMEVKTLSFRGFWSKIRSRDFYLPTFHTFILLLIIYWSGTTAVLIYFVEIVAKAINNDDATLYATISMYCVFLVGALLTTFLVLKFKHKTIILSNAWAIMVCLVCASLVTGLQSYGILSKDSYLLIYFLIAYMACNGLSTVYLLAAEIMPVKYRNIGGALYIIFNCLLYASSLKLSPYLFLYIGLSGTFLIYLVVAFLCTLFIWKYVPETKGRTLQELEDYYAYGKFVQRCNDEADVKLNGESLRVLKPVKSTLEYGTT